MTKQWEATSQILSLTVEFKIANILTRKQWERDNVKALADFLTPNMRTQDITKKKTLNDKRVETIAKSEYLN